MLRDWFSSRSRSGKHRRCVGPQTGATGVGAELVFLVCHPHVSGRRVLRARVIRPDSRRRPVSRAPRSGPAQRHGPYVRFSLFRDFGFIQLGRPTHSEIPKHQLPTCVGIGNKIPDTPIHRSCCNSGHAVKIAFDYQQNYQVFSRLTLSREKKSILPLDKFAGGGILQ